MAARNSGSLDANVLVRIITADIALQKAAALKLIKSSKSLIIADVALIETIYALTSYYKIPRENIIAVLDALGQNPKLEFNESRFRDLATLYTSHPALSVEDCYLVVKAKESNATPLWTFDKKLANQAQGMAREIEINKS